jgi:hypothetical protein
MLKQNFDLDKELYSASSIDTTLEAFQEGFEDVYFSRTESGIEIHAESKDAIEIAFLEFVTYCTSVSSL